MFKKVFILTIVAFSLPYASFAKTDLIQAGDEVTIRHEVESDALIAAETITLKGEVRGDFLGAGREITIDAPIAEDLRALGEIVSIESEVGGNVTVIAAEALIQKDATIGGNVFAVGALIQVDGTIHGDLRTVAETVDIQGTVGGDADLGELGTFTFGPDARIEGDLTYSARTFVEIPEGAVRGEVYYEELEDSSNFLAGMSIFGEIVWFFAALAVGLILIHFFERENKAIAQHMVRFPVKALLIGFVFLFITPLAALLLAITLIGIPFGLTLFGLWLVAIYISSLFAAIIIGTVVLHKIGSDKNKKSPVWALIVGLIIMRLVFLAPFIGGGLKFLVLIWGLGGLLLFIKTKWFKS